jgi:hypothetical protein
MAEALVVGLELVLLAGLVVALMDFQTEAIPVGLAIPQPLRQVRATTAAWAYLTTPHIQILVVVVALALLVVMHPPVEVVTEAMVQHQLLAETA